MHYVVIDVRWYARHKIGAHRAAKIGEPAVLQSALTGPEVDAGIREEPSLSSSASRHFS